MIGPLLARAACLLLLVSHATSIIDDTAIFSAASITSQITGGRATCAEIVDYFLKRANVYNSKVNALISYNPLAKQEALQLDAFFSANRRLKGSLHCVPILIKDNIDVAQMATTGAIRALRYSIPNKDALLVARLKAQGAVIIGKTNMAELAVRNEDTELGGLCKNPFDTRRSCGASSTGCGAGIATGMGIVAIGTDTGGSVITPSSFCGLFGLRPAMNQPSLDGVLPANLRQDTAGPLAKHIDDLVLAYSVTVDNAAMYAQYKQPVTNPASLRVKVITNFFDSFSLPTPLDNANYQMSQTVSVELLRALNYMKTTLRVNVTMKTLSASELQAMGTVLLPIIFQMAPCRLSCIKSSMNTYFGKSDVFQSDAPYKSFNDLAKSPLLSPFWADFFNQTNVADPAQSCATTCVEYDRNRVEFTKLVNGWLADVDAIAVPSEQDVAYLHGFTSGQLDIPSMIYFSSYTGNPSLNIPVSYVSSAGAVDGLPVGLLLVSRPDTLVNTFKIGKLYENYKCLSKLPSLTPLLPKSTINNLGEPLACDLVVTFALLCLCACF